MPSTFPFVAACRNFTILAAAGLTMTLAAPAQDSGQGQPAGAQVNGAASPAETAAPPDPSQVANEVHGVSQVRIVRLSQVRGVVRMDRNTGRGFEPAFANIPVVSGSALETASGIAEVELEDNSSLRLAPDSKVQFTELSRMADGGTVTVVTVEKGVVYADVQKTKGNLFALMDGTARLALQPGSHIRLDATRPAAQLAVLQGQAVVQVNNTSTAVNKHESVDLDSATDTVSRTQAHVEELAFDRWDQQESSYHSQKASLASSGGYGLYGANDLNYYGSFVNMPGCGSLWRPYFASAAWDPFANGVWTWYPTAGYSWVSPYPWGWLPFHSGSWVSCGGAGWGWQPVGGQWYGLNNAVAMRIARHPIHPMPAPPAPRTATTLVPVNMRGLTVSGNTAAEEAFTFRRDSAGLGVPRSGFGNLHGLSNTVARQGVARGPVNMPSYSAGYAAHNSSYTAGRTLGTAGSTASASRSYSSGSSSSSMHASSGGMSSAAPSMSAPSSGGGGGSHK